METLFKNLDSNQLQQAKKTVRKVLSVLKDYSKSQAIDEVRFYCSQEQVARNAGTTVRIARKWIGRLIEAGILIERESNCSAYLEGSWYRFAKVYAFTSRGAALLNITSGTTCNSVVNNINNTTTRTCKDSQAGACVLGVDFKNNKSEKNIIKNENIDFDFFTASMGVGSDSYGVHEVDFANHSFVSRKKRTTTTTGPTPVTSGAAGSELLQKLRKQALETGQEPSIDLKIVTGKWFRLPQPPAAERPHCPKCGQRMRLSFDRKTGVVFWGCPSWRDCGGNLPLIRKSAKYPRTPSGNFDFVKHANLFGFDFDYREITEKWDELSEYFQSTMDVPVMQDFIEWAGTVDNTATALDYVRFLNPPAQKPQTWDESELDDLCYANPEIERRPEAVYFNEDIPLSTRLKYTLTHSGVQTAALLHRTLFPSETTAELKYKFQEVIDCMTTLDRKDMQRRRKLTPEEIAKIKERIGYKKIAQVA